MFTDILIQWMAGGLSPNIPYQIMLPFTQFYNLVPDPSKGMCHNVFCLEFFLYQTIFLNTFPDQNTPAWKWFRIQLNIRGVIVFLGSCGFLLLNISGSCDSLVYSPVRSRDSLSYSSLGSHIFLEVWPTVSPLSFPPVYFPLFLLYPTL
jgi:hypothetical protein